MRSEAEVRAMLAIAKLALPDAVKSANMDPWDAAGAAALADAETRIEVLEWMLEPADSAEVARVKWTCDADGRFHYNEPQLRPVAEAEVASRIAGKAADPTRDVGWTCVVEPFDLEAAK